ncbi:MAG: AbrB/MazE/SpoVT family DNA-binding domain-containing protein [Dehalococcoidia bacterium]
MGTRVRHSTRIGKRNQVTIPAATLRRMGLKPGDRVDVVEDEDGKVRLETLGDWIARSYGALYRLGTPVLSDEELELEIKRASEEAATKRYLRTFYEPEPNA